MLWMKKFRKRKIQSIMILLMVGICVMLMAGSLTILTSLQKPFKDLMEETKAPELKVYPTVSSLITGKDWVGELEQLDSVDSVYQVNRHYITEKLTTNGKALDAFISMVAFDEKLHHRVRLMEGAMDGMTEEECYISSVIANENEVGIGDEIEVYYGDEIYRYKVKAVFADAYSLNSSFQMEILVNHIPECYTITPYYSVFIKEGKTDEDVVDDYVKAHDGLMDANFQTQTVVMGNASVTESILGAILLVISTVIFLVSLVMIRYMIRNSMLRDKQTIAIYKSMGYSDSEIRGIYQTFYQALAIIGSVLGILGAPIISHVFMTHTYENLGIQGSMFNVEQSLLCMLVVNGLVFIQVYRELRKLRDMKPVNILTGNEERLGIKKKKLKSSRFAMSFSPFSMALRTIERDKKNTILIIISCFLSVYMVNLAIVCFSNIDSMSEQNYYWIGFDNHDVSLTSTGDLESFDDICDEIKESPEVERIVKRNLDTGYCIPYHQSAAAMVYETYDGVEIGVLDGRNPVNTNEVVMGNLYMKELDKEIGDYLQVYLDAETKVDLLIVGNYQSFYNMGRGIKISGELLDKYDVAIAYPEASIYLKEGVDAEQFTAKMNKQYGEQLKATLRENLFANIMSTISDPQRAALGPFAGAAMLIGALNLIYIIYLKNLNNRRTNSIYKSIGYSAQHLVKVNCYYVGMIAVVSMVAAMPVFLITFPKMMLLAMSMFGFEEYPVMCKPLPLLMGNIGVLLIFLFGAVLSSKELYRTDMTELISE